MPLKTSGLEHVSVFKRQTMDQHPTLSYDYLCRACLTKPYPEDVKMVFFEREDRLWVRCPQCGVEEKVSDDSKTSPTGSLQTNL